MERLTALRYFTYIFLRHFVLSDVSLTVIFSNKLTATIVTRVGTHALMSVHVCYVFCLADESAFAQGAFVWFGGATHMRPPVEFEVPLRGERLIAHDTEVWTFAAMR